MAALLFAQTLGALHRVVHIKKPAHSIGTSMPAGEAQHAGARSGESRLASLFTHDEGSLDCTVFDQLHSTDVDLGSGACSIGVPILAFETPVVHAAFFIAAQARGFLARAPPLES